MIKAIIYLSGLEMDRFYGFLDSDKGRKTFARNHKKLGVFNTRLTNTQNENSLPLLLYSCPFWKYYLHSHIHIEELLVGRGFRSRTLCAKA
jgi:hypothetical protein